MLEPPPIPHASIMACVESAYDLQAAGLAFLPLGYDLDTAVYRLHCQAGQVYFLKLRRSAFAEITLTLPHHLFNQGMQTLIPPLPTRHQRLWTEMGEYKLILYPFIEGQDAYTVPLSADQWITFGASLKALHTASLPPSLLAQLPRETFSPAWRQSLAEFQAWVAKEAFSEPVAARLASFMRSHRLRLTRLIDRSSRLAASLLAQPPAFALCHGDLHPGNLHISPAGAIYLVDWDNVLLAPQEHDLNLIGGGGSSPWRSRREAALFYRGYAPARLDPLALAYYRYERIVVDLAEFCQQILLSEVGEDDRLQSLQYFTAQFAPGAEIDLAFRTESRLPALPIQPENSSPPQ